MKNAIIASLVYHLLTFSFAIALYAAEPDIIGKTVIIKTGKESTSCIRIENYVPVIDAFDRNASDACVFKVVAGRPPGTVTFEWFMEPGMFLQHRAFRLQLLKDPRDDATFRIVRALRGNEGVSFQSFNFPTHHLSIVDKTHLGIVQDNREPRKAVFFIQELPK